MTACRGALARCALVLAVAAVAAPVHAQPEFDATGTLTTTVAVGLPYTEQAGNFLAADLALDGELSCYAGNNTLFASARLGYDALTGQSGGNALERIFGKEHYDLRLKEAWYGYSGSWWAVRVGRQVASWGAADGIAIADILCPSDGTALLSGGGEKLGIDAAKVSLNTNTLIFDAYWIPFFTPATLPLAEGSLLRGIVVPQSVDLSAAGLGTVPVVVGDVALPELSLASGEYAVRASAYFRHADVSLYGFYGWDDEPVLSYTLNWKDNTPPKAESVSLGGQYERLWMVGADSSIPVGPVTIRLEAAFFPQRYFAQSGKTQIAAQLTGGSAAEPVRRNQLSFLGGADWIRGDLTLTAQYYGHAVFGDTEPIDAKPYTHGATASASYSLLGGNLELTASALLGLNDFDSAISAQVAYQFTDQMEAQLGATFFVPGPKETGTYGAYKDLSNVSLKGTFRF